MKKVAIVTIESENFGNRLQNYALQVILESLGCNVETIDRNNYAKISKKLSEKFKAIVKILVHAKGVKYSEFNQLIHSSKHYARKDEAEKNLESYYDYFVAGSDQLWNPYFPFVGKCDLLTFARSEQKISYAASFGIEELPDSKIELYKNALQDFKNISVRETSAVKLIEELTGRKAQVVLDPTLLLDGDKWKSVQKKPSICPKGKYCFVYAIGEKNKEFQKQLQEIEQQGEWEIFDIRVKNFLGFERCLGPAEFLYLIAHAEMILTDSFHATVFSILFHKSVKSFKRKGLDMSSRISTLADILGLQDKLLQGVLAIDEKVDYSEVDLRLDRERNESINFLREALEIK